MPPRSPLLSWTAGLIVCGIGALLVIFPIPYGAPQANVIFTVRFVAAVLAVFLADSLGGGWFGYVSIGIAFLGILHGDDAWKTALPLLVGCNFIALFLRHLEPNWFGVWLGSLAFTIPVLLVFLLTNKLDPNLKLPLDTLYPLVHGLSGAVALLIAKLLDPRAVQNTA